MRIATIAVAVLAVTACSRTVKVQSDPNSGRVDVDMQRPGADQNWRGVLNPVGGSGVSGTARGTSGHDMTHVMVSISGAQPGARLPWHVHEGQCGEGSPPIVGPASAYPVMTVGSDGRASAEAHLSMDLNEAKSYIVNVHASPTNLGTIVSCGDYDD